MTIECERQTPTNAGSSCHIRLQVEAEFQNLEHFRSAWDDAVREFDGPIYMTFDWLKSWWDFYGDGKELRLFLFWNEGKIVGIVPLYLESLGIVRTRVARIVGACIPPKTFNPPVREDLSFDVFSLLLTRLFAGEGCDLLSLGPVSENWAPAAGLRKACEEMPRLVGGSSFLPRDLQTVFRLPNTFEDYLAGLSSSERKNRLKRVRHLEREHLVTTDVMNEAASVGQEFERFLDRHAAQWRAVGKGGHFEAWPRSEEFNRKLVASQAVLGRVRFFRMLVDGKPVVSRYAFILGSTIYSELPAREVGEPWDKLGIGAISMLKFNEQLIGQGVEYVDSGLGGYEHKTQLGGIETRVGIWRVEGASLASRSRARLLYLYSSAIRGVFQKIWYRRIVPRLPTCFGRTQLLYSISLDV